VPIEFIEKKLERLHLLSDDENEEKKTENKEEKKNEDQKPHCGPRKGHCGPRFGGQGKGPCGQGAGGFGDMLKNIFSANNINPNDLQNMATSAGFNFPENAFQGMCNGDFTKMKSGGGNYIKKRAHFVNGTDPEFTYLLAPGAT
jgi:hypothetical protein